MTGLRESLVGAWELVDVVEEALDGSPSRRPHGERPVGLILYTHDGYMSAQIMERQRGRVESCDWSSLTAEEYAEEARGYFAYAGPYEVDEERGTVTHSVVASLFPGWVGSAQVRVAELEGERLVLRSAAPVCSGGKLVVVQLTWRRAAPVD
jgi:hypothetical protein